MNNTAQTSALPTPTALTWGEILWDCLPRGMFLGGAPYNVAFHLCQLGLPTGLASAVGEDFPGRLARRRATEAGVDTEFLATLPEWETGHVLATLDEKGNASYTIAEPVAWDRIPSPAPLLESVRTARLLVFGSLAQRRMENRQSLQKIAQVCRQAGGFVCFDVNLRAPFAPPARPVEEILELARLAQLVKLNVDELEILTHGMPGQPSGGPADGPSNGPSNGPSELNQRCGLLAEKTGADAVCVTLGAAGALWWTPSWSVQASAPTVQVVDTVGAGDAFLAGVLRGWIDGQMNEPQAARKALERATALGARVAASEGATPTLDVEALGFDGRPGRMPDASSN